MNDRVALVVQARMTSSRLPGKVLLPLAGAPALVRMMERVRRAQRAEDCLVATSDDPSDDVIVATCEEHGIPCTRGALDDVLARFVTAVPPDATVVVRLTADCPLVDPELVDAHVQRFLTTDCVDVVSNAVSRTFPDGLDVEVASRGMLERAHERATSAYDREHVMPWIHRQGRSLALTQETDLSLLRFTLDTKDDYEAIAGIFDALYPSRPRFTTRDVYELLLQRPELVRVAGQSDPGPVLDAIARHLSLTRSAA